MVCAVYQHLPPAPWRLNQPRDGGFRWLSTDILFFKATWVPPLSRAQSANRTTMKGSYCLVTVSGRDERHCQKPCSELLMLCSAHRDWFFLNGKASFLGMGLSSLTELLTWTSDTPCPRSWNPAWGLSFSRRGHVALGSSLLTLQPIITWPWKNRAAWQAAPWEAGYHLTGHGRCLKPVDGLMMLFGPQSGNHKVGPNNAQKSSCFLFSQLWNMLV